MGDTDCSSYLRSLNTDAPSESPSNSPIDSTETPTSFPTETERLPAPDHVVNGECTEMLPLCASETYKYTVYSGYDITDLEAKNFYGCMRSQPNPSWFYFEIETGGDLILDLKANEDIDYVVWGPYDSVVDAIALCNGGIEESSLIDCGFTQTNEEVINITNAIAGQTYILLVTNYKDDIQNMTLSKASGDADTDCSSYLRSLNTDAPSESPSNSPIDSTETPTSFPTETETETPTSFPTETERLPAPDHVVNGECTEMLPLCASETYKYTVYSGYDITDLEAKNFYGCMRSQPNPSWFYFEIETGGDLILDLKANEDIDYVVWGPYDSVVDAIALCNGGIEESSLVDCGFTSTNEEVINITNAIAGQTYILLVTNYKDDIQNMTEG